MAKGASGRSLARRVGPQVSQGHPGVAKGASGRPLARGVGPQVLQRHPRVAKGRESLPLQGLWSSLRPGSARHPRLQVVLRQGRVAKRASIGTLARGPLPQVPQGHPRVAKGASIGTLARGPLPQVLQSHPSVANGHPSGPPAARLSCRRSLSARSLSGAPSPSLGRYRE